MLELMPPDDPGIRSSGAVECRTNAVNQGVDLAFGDYIGRTDCKHVSHIADHDAVLAAPPLDIADPQLGREDATGARSSTI
ncbi:hypothetical protein [Mesorhizobium sp. M3A.F.Ca.ET.201.01.1.1]|uniref:hypothetical protein n=1 Tax=Mesorhizobium sp. M3A.F.Ca.ET.201.01.1.1 TaxID=2563946 RepID=UPI001FEDAAE0|nr:hypothetical protein [Mesorhizobium sp. M3A.F.Ca.ET.201.01.1.1]